tara:strand:+ start:34632 stop:35660 length:1029 start_codon:yes stop_codon:yes gene_type:complete
VKGSSAILLIYTGGTIGMVMDPKTGKLKPFSLDNLLKTIPELQKIDFSIHSTSFKNPIDSSNATPELWQELCDIISENYRDYHGFVILHGTDTMAYSASALSFMLSGLNKPVIFTGSQLPIGMVRTDGKENLLAALEIASERDANGNPRVPEVGIYFDSFLFRGNRSHKSSTQNFNAFSSPNFPPLAEAGVDIIYSDRRILPKEDKKFKIYREVEQNILVVTLFPGLSNNLLQNAMNSKNLKGVILRTFGAGNAPTNSEFLSVLEKLVNRGVAVMNVTQCAHGKVDQLKYETGSSLQNVGVIGGADITLEAAITKMMVSLGNFEPEQVFSNLNKSLRGELTE